MTISGLEYSAYYLYNPIWVDINEITETLNFSVTVQGRTFPFKMTAHNGNVNFDLAKVINGVIREIENKKSIVYTGTSWVVDGAYVAVLNFGEQTLQKTFVLGGVKENASNVYVSGSLYLSNNKWENIPSFTFSLVDNVITGIPVVEANRRLRVNCDYAALIFRNIKGGFETFVFEDFDVNSKAKDLGYYFNGKEVVDSGTETAKKITLRTKLKREDYPIIESLIDSKEVYRFLDNKLIRLVGGNEVSINNKLKTQDFEIEFDIPITYSQQW